MQKQHNWGFAEVTRLDGNVGYLKLASTRVHGGGGGAVAAGAMALLANTDALIIDLRENQGGTPSMVSLLATYLFDGAPVQLTETHWRLRPRVRSRSHIEPRWRT